MCTWFAPSKCSVWDPHAEGCRRACLHVGGVEKRLHSSLCTLAPNCSCSCSQSTTAVVTRWHACPSRYPLKSADNDTAATIPMAAAWRAQQEQEPGGRGDGRAPPEGIDPLPFHAANVVWHALVSAQVCR